jgi:cyanophycinase-like exopeptidase
MTLGPIGLHGGGELMPGDEPFLRAILHRAADLADARVAGRAPGSPGATDRPVRRIVVLPTAAAAERPDLAVEHARVAFGRIAAGLGIDVRVTAAMVVDAVTAGEPRWVAALAGADLVYLPGGDPGRIPAALRGSLALRAMLEARARGAVIAGASAGAMALAPWTWTPRGGVTGLGLVPGIVVVPHAERFAGAGAGTADAWRRWLGDTVPSDLGILALDERTGVVSGEAVGGGRRWEVAGAGRVRWMAPGASDPVTAANGDLLLLPA